MLVIDYRFSELSVHVRVNIDYCLMLLSLFDILVSFGSVDSGRSACI